MSAANQTRPNRQRFPNVDDDRSFEDIADPETNEDDTSKSKWQYIKENKAFFAFMLPVGALATILFIGYFWHLVPEVLGNRRFQFGVGWLASIGIVAHLIDKRREQQTKQYQHLVLDTENGLNRYLGAYNKSDGVPYFEPAKSVSRFGSLEYYTNEEFSNEMVQSVQMASEDGDDRAKIMLHPSLVQETETDTGLYVLQSTTRLEPASRSSSFVARAPEPRYIRRGEADALKQDLEEMRKDREDMRENLSALQRRLQQAKDLGAMDPQEWLNSHREFALQLLDRARGTRRSDAQENGTGSSSKRSLDGYTPPLDNE